MSTKELIQAEIDHVREDQLDELYRLIKDFVHAKEHEKKAGLMSRLKQIKIDAPEDFAANLDLYMTGEKSVEQDLR